MSRATLLLALGSFLGFSEALDLEFDKVTCDSSLPVFAYDDGIGMTCDGNSRCTFGDEALITGTLVYKDLAAAEGMYNSSGYATANLQLMTLTYELFEYLPFNFCGDWVKGTYTFESCPGDGSYRFEIPYQLPTNQDVTTWFATGWQGTSEIKISTERDPYSPLLADCKLHFKTYVTQSEEEGWATLPSAAVVSLVLVGIVACLFCTVCCLACRPRRKYAVDVDTDYDRSRDFKEMKDTETSDWSPPVEKDDSLEERVRKLSLKMDY